MKSIMGLNAKNIETLIKQKQMIANELERVWRVLNPSRLTMWIWVSQWRNWLAHDGNAFFKLIDYFVVVSRRVRSHHWFSPEGFRAHQPEPPLSSNSLQQPPKLRQQWALGSNVSSTWMGIIMSNLSMKVSPPLLTHWVADSTVFVLLWIWDICKFK